MSELKTFGRREFTVASALAVLSGVSITISSCGGGSSPSTPSTPNPTPAPTPSSGGGDKIGSISANHGHSAVITAAELTAGGALSLDIRGTSDHPHTVELAAAEIMSIAANGRVSKTSSNNDGHNHTVTFN